MPGHQECQGAMTPRSAGEEIVDKNPADLANDDGTNLRRPGSCYWPVPGLDQKRRFARTNQIPMTV